jgi:hypothetical protein
MEVLNKIYNMNVEIKNDVENEMFSIDMIDNKLLVENVFFGGYNDFDASPDAISNFLKKFKRVCL